MTILVAENYGSGKYQRLTRNGLTIAMCRDYAILLTVFAAYLLPIDPRLRAQDLPSDAAALSDDVDQLSDGSFSERQQATLEMWRVRDRSRDQVQEAAKHPDPEVAGRAQWILRQWRRGSLPGTPPEISRLLASKPGPAGIDQLMIEGQFAAATVAIEESKGTPEFDLIQRRLHLGLLRRFPIYAQAAIENDQVLDLLELLNVIAMSKEVAVARAQLMQYLGIDIDAHGLLPESADLWTESERIKANALVRIALGRLDEAIEVAAQGSDKRLVYQCRAIAGRWKEAMDSAIESAEAAEPGSAEHARYWSRVMICADRAGNVDVFRRAADELVAANVDDNGSARDLRWRTLAGHGEVDAAIAMLDKFDPVASAEVAIDASRIEHAFAVLGCPVDQVDRRIGSLVDAAIVAQKEISDGENQAIAIADSASEILVLIRCLLMIGREDLARSAVARLCDSEVKIGNLELRDIVLQSLRYTSRSDWIGQFAVREDEKVIALGTKSILVRVLSDIDSNSFDLVIESLKVTHPSLKGSRANQEANAKLLAAAACQLVAGEMPAELDADDFFKKLHDLAIMPGRAAGRRVPNRQPAFVRPRIRGNMNLVRLLLRHGRAEYATAVIQKLAETGDQDALLMLAEQELDRGSTELATSFFETLTDSVLGNVNTLAAANIVGDERAVKALIGKWTIAVRNGDNGQADRLRTQIRISLLGPSSRLRNSIAQYLVERDQHELAVEIYDDLLPLAFFDNQEGISIYDVVRGYALLVRERNVGLAARWYDLAVCEVIRSGNFRPGAYITLPQYVQRWSVEAALESSDELAIEKHVDRIMQLDPLDIALAESILPNMRESGAASLADSTLDRMMEVGVDHCQRFPLDATTSNNLAWVAAMNDRQLPTALKLAERAVYWEPDSAVYRDTLAEILFRLGRVDEALQVEQACLLDDATQWHLYQQVEKYQEAVGR